MPTPHASGAPRIDDHVRHALEALGHRWSLSVLLALWSGPLGYNRVRERVPLASPRMLTHTLRRLERHGLVCRVAGDGGRHRLYGLTDLAVRLIGVVAEGAPGWTRPPRSAAQPPLIAS